MYRHTYITVLGNIYFYADVNVDMLSKSYKDAQTDRHGDNDRQTKEQNILQFFWPLMLEHALSIMHV
jgi:hypothetical protein